MDNTKCIGFGGIVCKNNRTQTFDYCTECFAKRMQKLTDGFCVAKNGTCRHKKHSNHNFCTECHLQKRIDNEEKKASNIRCSCIDNRGGVACSSCDVIWYDYDQAVTALAIFRKRRAEYLSGKIH